MDRSHAEWPPDFADSIIADSIIMKSLPKFPAKVHRGGVWRHGDGDAITTSQVQLW
jgi:hypothetical protein